VTRLAYRAQVADVVIIARVHVVDLGGQRDAHRPANLAHPPVALEYVVSNLRPRGRKC
jgi:hypothetical protein